jgi:hypothetical protein
LYVWCWWKWWRRKGELLGRLGWKVGGGRKMRRHVPMPAVGVEEGGVKARKA